MITIMSNNLNFFEVKEKTPLPVVLYGAGTWGGLFIETGFVEIDFLCDKNTEKGAKFKELEVHSILELYETYHTSHIYLISSLNNTLADFHVLYADLSVYNMNITIVDLHKNIGFIGSNNRIDYDGQSLELFSHIYNCGYKNTRCSERAIEIPIALQWLSKHKENLIEIGAVMPYYFPGIIQDVVDPADNHFLVNEKKSIFDLDLSKKNVLCISTVEHIGTGQYGLLEEKNTIHAINKILQESNTCLITCPVGENPILDEWLENNHLDPRITVYARKYFGNNWERLENTSINVSELLHVYKKSKEAYTKKKLVGADTAIIVIEKK